MKLVIHHHTRFRYSQPLLYTVQSLHLWPVSSACQSVEHWELRVPGTLCSQPDIEGNRVHSFSLSARPEKNLRENSVTARGTVVTHGVAEFTDSPGLMAARARGERPSAADLVALAGAVADKVQYRKGSTGVETTALEAFDWGLGVCQDQAHVMVAVCRSIGLPARYVSGYFYAANEPDLASHAWVDVCVDPANRRWLSLDVTHRCPTDERHIRLAAATDYSACTPVKGLRRGGGEEDMSVDVRISLA